MDSDDDVVLARRPGRPLGGRVFEEQANTALANAPATASHTDRPPSKTRFGTDGSDDERAVGETNGVGVALSAGSPSSKSSSSSSTGGSVSSHRSKLSSPAVVPRSAKTGDDLQGAVGFKRSISAGSSSSSDTDSSSSSDGSSSSDSSSGSSSSSSSSDSSAAMTDDGFVRKRPNGKNRARVAQRASGNGKRGTKAAVAARARPAPPPSGADSDIDSSHAKGTSRGPKLSDLLGKRNGKGKDKGAALEEDKAARQSAEEAAWGKAGVWGEADDEREAGIAESRTALRLKLLEAGLEEDAAKDPDLRDGSGEVELVDRGRTQANDVAASRARLILSKGSLHPPPLPEGAGGTGGMREEPLSALPALRNDGLMLEDEAKDGALSVGAAEGKGVEGSFGGTLLALSQLPTQAQGEEEAVHRGGGVESDSDSSTGSGTSRGSSSSASATRKLEAVVTATAPSLDQLDIVVQPVPGLDVKWRRRRQELLERLQSRIKAIEAGLANAELERQALHSREVAAAAGAIISDRTYAILSSRPLANLPAVRAEQKTAAAKQALSNRALFGQQVSDLAHLVQDDNALAEQFGLAPSSKRRGGDSPGPAHGVCSKADNMQSKAGQKGLAALMRLPDMHELTTVAAAALMRPAAVLSARSVPPTNTAQDAGTRATFIDLDFSDEEMEVAAGGRVKVDGQPKQSGVAQAETGICSASGPGSSPDSTAAFLADKGEDDKCLRAGVIGRAMMNLKAEAERRDAALRDLGKKAADQARRKLAELKARRAVAAEAAKSASRKGKLLRTAHLHEDGDDDKSSSDSENADAELLNDEEANTVLLADYLPPLLEDMVRLGQGMGISAAGNTAAGTAAATLLSAYAAGRTIAGMTGHTAVSMLATAAAADRAAASSSSSSSSTAVPKPVHAPAFFRQGSLGEVDVGEITEEHRNVKLRLQGQGRSTLSRSPGGSQLRQLGKSGVARLLTADGEATQVSADKQRLLLRKHLQAAGARQDAQLEARRRGFRDMVALGLERARRYLRLQFNELMGQLAEALQAAGGEEAAAKSLGYALHSGPAALPAALPAAAFQPAVNGTPDVLSLPVAPPVKRTYGHSRPEVGATVGAETTQEAYSFDMDEDVDEDCSESKAGQQETKGVTLHAGADEEDFATAEDDAAVAMTVARTGDEVEEGQADAVRMSDDTGGSPFAQEGRQPVLRSVDSAIFGMGRIGAMFAKQAPKQAAPQVVPAESAAPSLRQATTKQATHCEASELVDLSDDEEALADALEAEQVGSDGSSDGDEAENVPVGRLTRLRKVGSDGASSVGSAGSQAGDDSEPDLSNDAGVDAGEAGGSDGDEDEDEEGEADGADAPSRMRATNAVLDDEDIAYETAKAAEADAADRLANPRTYADMVRAEADAARRAKMGVGVGGEGKKGRNRYADAEAEMSDEEGNEGAGKFGTSGAQMRLGADGRLVNRLVEEAEEARALGLGVDLATELDGAVVEELSGDEEEGDHEAHFRAQQEAAEAGELRRLQKAIATGNMAMLRRRARGRGIGATSFARDAGAIDAMDDEAAAEEEDEDEESYMRRIQREDGERLVARREDRDGDDDDDGESESKGEAAEASRAAKEMARRDAEAAAAEEEEGEDDGTFDFAASMRARMAGEAAERAAARARAAALAQAEAAEAATQALGEEGAAEDEEEDPEAPAVLAKAHLAHLHSLFADDSDEGSDGEGSAGHNRGGVGGGSLRGLSIRAPSLSTSGDGASTGRPLFGPAPTPRSGTTPLSSTSTYLTGSETLRYAAESLSAGYGLGLGADLVNAYGLGVPPAPAAPAPSALGKSKGGAGRGGGRTRPPPSPPAAARPAHSFFEPKARPTREGTGKESAACGPASSFGPAPLTLGHGSLSRAAGPATAPGHAGLHRSDSLGYSGFGLSLAGLTSHGGGGGSGFGPTSFGSADLLRSTAAGAGTGGRIAVEGPKRVGFTITRKTASVADTDRGSSSGTGSLAIPALTSGDSTGYGWGVSGTQGLSNGHGKRDRDTASGYPVGAAGGRGPTSFARPGGSLLAAITTDGQAAKRHRSKLNV